MPKCDFNKVAKQLIKIALCIGCSPVILLHISKASFTKNTSKWLLLYWSRGPSVEIDFQSRPLKVCTRSYTCKRKKLCHTDVIFSSNPVKNSYEKHFGMFLDTKFDFDEHFKGVLFASPKIFSRDRLFCRSIFLLLDLTYITVILSMTTLL